MSATRTKPPDVTALPARQADAVDLIRAADGAAVVGDLFAVRRLLASALRLLDNGAEREGGDRRRAGAEDDGHAR